MNHHTIFKSLLITLVVFAFMSLANAQTTGTNQQKSDSIIQQNKHAVIFDVVEQMPQYPGGESALLKFISANIKYPVIAQENGTQGTVVVKLVVNTLGEVENAKVIRSVSPECDNEALRVVCLTKNWIPGKQNGKLVNVHYTIPIQFKLIDSSKPEKSKVYEVIEQMPEFPGGERALMDFIGSNLKYPLEAQKSGIQGTVLIRFVISKTGKVTKVEVLRSVFSALDDEAVRVVKLLPDWIPGEQKGQKVNVYFTLPIKFKLT